MVRSADEAIAEALKQKTNVPGTCQKTVRGWYDAPSAGDRDKDGDADAVDGWLSEPVKSRHPGDRNPPIGVPLAFGGGSKGYGHRAMTVAAAGIRSTDMFGNRYKSGVTSTVIGKNMSDAIAIIERSMGVHYLGWSPTIDGQPFKPHAPAKPPVKKPAPKKKTSRGKRVDQAIKDIEALIKLVTAAKKATKNQKRIADIEAALTPLNNALKKLRKIEFIK